MYIYHQMQNNAKQQNFFHDSLLKLVQLHSKRSRKSFSLFQSCWITLILIKDKYFSFFIECSTLMEWWFCSSSDREYPQIILQNKHFLISMTQNPVSCSLLNNSFHCTCTYTLYNFVMMCFSTPSNVLSITSCGWFWNNWWDCRCSDIA